MNILLLTLVNIESISEKQNIYSDLCRSIIRLGHSVNMVCPAENGTATRYEPCEGGGILKVKTGAIQKTGLIKKGINTILIGSRFKKAIRERLGHYKTDMLLYSTPPVTLASTVRYLKKRDGCFTCLMLKDIFPQNAADIGIMATSGVKGLVYRYFKAVEKRLYSLSDYIGTMSKANTKYLLEHEPWLDRDRVGELPNAFSPSERTVSPEKKRALREKYGLPEDKTVFLYGGNLGKPQNVPHICRCLDAIRDMENVFTVICGNGTDYNIIENYLAGEASKRVRAIKWLPRGEYEEFVGACDVGLIFLDYRFTIPNFPSRLLSYMHSGLPVLACTDTATDIDTVILEGGFGWWCPGNDPEQFKSAVLEALGSETAEMGRRAKAYLLEHYSSDNVARQIIGLYERLHR